MELRTWDLVLTDDLDSESESSAHQVSLRPI